MAKKKVQKNKLDKASIKLYASMHSAILARIIVGLTVIVFIVGMQLIYKNSFSKQAVVSPDASVKTVCLIENKSCINKNQLKQSKPSHKHAPKKTAQIDQAGCEQYQTLIAQYDQATTKEFNQVNQQADNARSQAQNNGESYQDFDSNLNSIFSSYNNNVTALYNSYSAQVGSCKDELTPPSTFNMFTP
jgi:hypothetical protein